VFLSKYKFAGGTAIGTGIAATRGYSRRCIEHLRQAAGMPALTLARDMIEATANTGARRQVGRFLTGIPLCDVCSCHSTMRSATGRRGSGGFLSFSSVLRRCAVKISKICNDLRLLASGPRAGFNEINLPGGEKRWSRREISVSS
jgi:aspartate ammonia-lyase